MNWHARNIRLSITLLATCGLACRTETPTTDHVIRLELCPDLDGGECTGVADGETPVAVRACVPESRKDRASGLEVELHTTQGTWAGTTTGSLKSPLGRERCLTHQLIPSTRPGSVMVSATLAGYTVERELELDRAPIASLTLTTSPNVIEGDKRQTINVRARANTQTGKLSDHCRVAFQVIETDPPNSYTSLSPNDVAIDATGVAATDLVLDSKVNRVEVRAWELESGVEATTTVQRLDATAE